MLSLQMKSGDYVTIGEDVVVQVFRESGPQVRVSIKAPREVPIIRGAVLEQAGQKRPEGLHKKARKNALPIRFILPAGWRASRKSRMPGRKNWKPASMP